MSTTTDPPLATNVPKLSTETQSLKKSLKKQSTSSSAKRIKKRSTDAFVMGYVMSKDDFVSFVSSLRDPEEIEKEGSLSLRDSMGYYVWFRSRLPNKLDAPRLEEMYPSQKMMDSDLPLDVRVSHMFFPFRYIAYKGKEQLSDSHPDSKIIREESVKDRARMTRWVEYIQLRGGKLDFDMVKYGYEKMLHPRLW